MKKSLIFPSILVMLSVMAPIGHMPAFAGPWQWQMYLKVETAESAPMNRPTALFTDKSSGRYYVVDSGNNRLVSFDKDGAFINEFNAKGELKVPFDMVRDANGQILIVEKEKNTISTIDVRNKQFERHTIRHNGTKIFPDRLEIEGNTLYLLDKSSGDVLEMDADLNVKQRFGCTNCEYGFTDFKVRKGVVWALERKRKTVYQFDKNGDLVTEIRLNEAIDFPCSLAVGPAGLIYVLDRHQGVVSVFDRRGTKKYNFLTSGHARGQLYYPAEIRFDSWERLCVVEEGNGRIQIFTR
ncbi:MAG: hypothetical protein U9O82_04035 [Thermodesulfobacteriota bacterium]|nr:hypothetical protein [Thermodesulfobacteriota bacterium]